MDDKIQKVSSCRCAAKGGTAQSNQENQLLEHLAGFDVLAVQVDYVHARQTPNTFAQA